jgi:hypothetical protein
MKNTNTINGLRFQKYDSKEVHVHDDSRSVKFVSSTTEFKKDVKNALSQLKGDGAIIVGGTSKEKLLLIKDGKVLSAVILSDQDITKELNSFLSSL